MSENTPDSRSCRNCDASINSNYCHACGQRDIDFRRDWRGLIGEYAAAFLNLDGKIPRGIYQLLFHPGAITAEFLSGKRASQIPTLRLYLFASLIFFLWVDSGRDATFIEESEAPTEQQLEKAERQMKDTTGSDYLAKKLREKFENPESFIATFNQWVPRVFLLGVPLLALATLLVFRQQQLVYLEHIIVSIHLQTFILLWGISIGILSNIIGLLHTGTANFFWAVFIWWIPLYPIFAFKKIFELSWKRAIVSSIALEFIFLFMIGIGMVAASIISFFIA